MCVVTVCKCSILCSKLFLEVDEIYHLASPASPPHYMYNPVKTIKTNTVGTVNVLVRQMCTTITRFPFPYI